ncbi:MAG: hypothetical protein HY000_13975 [Planctomycetes bacterium]|nr:hypothetical protein [Planctomycetota bacterium]
MRLFQPLLFCLLIACWLGCGAEREGPPRYALSGAATLADGKPIPMGELMLEPDTSVGNNGPASTVQIRDGQYSLPADQGVVGGKYIATILAYDGVPFGESTQGKPLIKAPYVEKIDLPAEDSTRDFQVK